ncbi:MAG: hypothetical protein A2X83_06205 [Desulfuromonadales bacterium GWD2_54_10]|nr:MAG: hypothetical protein A2X83_06205 [Desulfuromonadales bacterium GWD2_54_10]
MLSLSPETARGQLTMNRYLILLLLWMVFIFGNLFFVPGVAVSEDEAIQIRLAYFELSRVRLLNMLDASYEEYRDAVKQSRKQMWLLRDDPSEAADKLRTAQSYYELALVIWSFQAEAGPRSGILLTDEPYVLAVCRQCPDIPVVHQNGLDHVSVQNGVACLWRLSAAVLNKIPTGSN